MMPLFSSMFCPRECDRPRVIPTAETDQGLAVGEPDLGFPVRQYASMVLEYYAPAAVLGDQYRLRLFDNGNNVTYAYPIVGQGWCEPGSGRPMNSGFCDVASRVSAFYSIALHHTRVLLEFRRLDGSAYEYTSIDPEPGQVYTSPGAVHVPLCRVRPKRLTP